MEETPRTNRRTKDGRTIMQAATHARIVVNINVNDAPEKLIKILKAIYREPMSVVVIRGLPKTGKTDFASFIMDLLKQLGLVKQFASNTHFSVPWVKPIESLNNLRTWGLENRDTKLFIYDELIESATNRRAMSDLNVAWVQFLPQISKMHIHILAIVQEDQQGKRYYESVFTDPVFLRGVWTKVTKTFATFRSHYLKQTGDLDTEEYSLNNIPRSAIRFDKDLVATFSLNAAPSMADFSKMTRTMQIAMMYKEDGNGYDEIQKQTGLDRKQIQRELKRICKIFVGCSLEEKAAEGKS